MTILAAAVLAAIHSQACIRTPEPRCFPVSIIYSTELAPRDAPMPVPSPWGK